jgi:hypothetical protein
MELLAAREGAGIMQTSLDRRARRGKVPKPSKTGLKQAIELDTMRYQARIERMARDVALYRQASSGKPSDFREGRDKAVSSAALSTLVNRMKAILSNSKISYKAPWKTTDESKSSQIIEDYCQQMRRMFERQYGENLQQDEFFYQLLHGSLVYRVLPDVEDSRFPYNVSLIDPATCFPTWGSGKKGMVRMVRKYNATVAEVITDYSLTQSEQKKLAKDLGYDQFDMAGEFWTLEREVTEYWDSWWRYVDFGDTEIMPLTAHEYGRVPFIYMSPVGEPRGMRTPGGQYNEEMPYYAGETLTRGVGIQDDIQQKGVSVFHYLVKTHRLREALATILYNEVEKAQNPPTVTYVAGHLINEKLPPLDQGRGGNNKRILNLQQVEGLPTSPRPTDLAPLSNQMNMEWLDGSIPPQQFGPDMGGSSGGIGPEAIFGAVREIAFPYVKCWEQAQSAMAEMWLDYYVDFVAPAGLIKVPEFTDTGRFSGQMNELKVDDIDRVGTYVEVHMKGSTIQNLAAKVAMANQAIQAGLSSQRYAMEEYMEHDDPEKMLGEIISEKAIQQQKMMEMFIIPQAFIQQGNPEFAKMWLQLVVAPQMAQMMAPPMPGMPGGDPASMGAPAPGGGMLPPGGGASPPAPGEPSQGPMM